MINVVLGKIFLTAYVTMFFVALWFIGDALLAKFFSVGKSDPVVEVIRGIALAFPMLNFWAPICQAIWRDTGPEYTYDDE